MSATTEPRVAIRTTTTITAAVSCVHAVEALRTHVEFLGLSPSQWDIVGTIATALSFLVAATAAVVAVVQLRHTRRIHRDQTRPYMVITIEPGETGYEFADIVIKNIGSTPAYDLTIDVTPPLVRAAEEEEDYPIAAARLFTETIPMWAPGQELRQFFDSHLERYPEQERREKEGEPPLPERFTATLTYYGQPVSQRRRVGRKPWIETQVLDANVGKGILYTNVYGLHHAAQALREIEKLLKKATILKGEVHAVTEPRDEWYARKVAEREAQRGRARAWRESEATKATGGPLPDWRSQVRERLAELVPWLKLPAQTDDS